MTLINRLTEFQKKCSYAFKPRSIEKRNAPQPNSLPELAPIVKGENEQIIGRPVVTEENASAGGPQLEARSNPPEEKGSNTSLATKTGKVNIVVQSSVPAYSQDVNSTQSPSKEYQLLGVFQVMMLNWPTTWDSSQVEKRC